MTTSEQTQTTRHVVVIGGGFAGLAAVRALRKAPVEVTLVDRHAYSTFQPLLYQVATAALNPGDVTWFLRSLRHRQRNVRFVNADVDAIDHASRTVHLSDGQTTTYDDLVVAAGVTASFFGIPGAAEHALPLYTRTQAIEVRDAVFSRLEAAAAQGDGRDLRVVVVGGGATGVETAGALAELRNEAMAVTYPELDPRRTHITVVEMLDTLLPPFQERLRRYARTSLERRGVEVVLGTAVEEVRDDGVVVRGGELIPAGLVVWASGVRVDERTSSWDLPRTRGNRVLVDSRFRVEGLDHVYAVGDVAATADDPLPQLAQPAIQAGAYVGRALASDLPVDHLPPFRYRNRGTLAMVGRGSAVAQVPHAPSLTGRIAWLLWMGVHIRYLTGVRNRLATTVNLACRYLPVRHGHSAIVGETQVQPAGTGAHVA